MSTAARRRVLIYVQHLLGIGHLQRSAIVARACAQAGLEVVLVSGGNPVPDLPLGEAGFVQLPPCVATDPSFKLLMDADGRPVDDAWKARRRERLLELWRAFNPHALVIELYPFGRRLMRFELVPLLEAARAAAQRPLIVSSARDVLQDNEDNAARLQKMLEAFERYFDRALVHGDPAFIPFERTFPHAPRIAARIAYTGYVVDSSPPPPAGGADGEGEAEVLVSAGGGAFGAAVLETAIRARGHHARRAGLARARRRRPGARTHRRVAFSRRAQRRRPRDRRAEPARFPSPPAQLPGLDQPGRLQHPARDAAGQRACGDGALRRTQGDGADAARASARRARCDRHRRGGGAEPADLGQCD